MNSKSLAGMLFAAALAAPPAFAYPSPSSSHISSPATTAGKNVSPGLAPADLLVSSVADARQQGGVRRPRSGGGGQGSGGGNNGGAVSRPRSSGGGERAGGSRPSGGGSRGGAVRRESPPPPPPSSRPSSDGARARTRPAYDHAIPRSEAPQRPSNPIYIYRPNPWPWYYDPWVYGGLGVGYGYYSPWSWYGPGWGPGYGYYGYGNGYGHGYGYDYGRHDDDYDGKVRLKVKPRDAEVYVDGYYAGTVDDFDGTFQGLRLNPGGYRIEIRKPGFETLSYDVRVQSDRTITFEGEMQREP